MARNGLSESRAKSFRLAQARVAKMPGFFERGKIENEVADRDADPSRAVVRPKDPVGQVFEREVRVRRDLDERTEWSRHC